MAVNDCCRLPFSAAVSTSQNARILNVTRNLMKPTKCMPTCRTTYFSCWSARILFWNRVCWFNGFVWRLKPVQTVIYSCRTPTARVGQLPLWPVQKCTKVQNSTGCGSGAVTICQITCFGRVLVVSIAVAVIAVVGIVVRRIFASGRRIVRVVFGAVV